MKNWGWVLLGCLLPGFAASGEELGRLFFTTAERANLDHQRRLGKLPGKLMKTGKDDVKTAAAIKREIPAMVSVGGYVKRSDGKNTIWVNGQPMQEETGAKDFEIDGLRGDTHQIRVRLPGIKQAVSLRAGQSYDPLSGKVLDSQPVTTGTAPGIASAVGSGPDYIQKKKNKPLRKVRTSRKSSVPIAFSENR